MGSGNIGADLLVKTTRSVSLECTYLIGRNTESNGLAKARELGIATSIKGVQEIIDNPNCCDIVFDATSALDHKYHWSILEKMGKFVVDMTPSNIGRMIVPSVNLDDCIHYKNVNMISCGGQASIPIASVIGKTHPDVEYIEVVSSISSKSAGPATRLNMDEYIETTEKGLRLASGCKNTKVILILNPAEPPVDMQTTISAKIRKIDIETLRDSFNEIIRKVQTYVPGYKVLVPPVIESNRIVTMVKVQGTGDYLPPFAGNLDIINCAALATAECIAETIR